MFLNDAQPQDRLTVHVEPVVVHLVLCRQLHDLETVGAQGIENLPRLPEQPGNRVGSVVDRFGNCVC